jgi:hypothetical protein
MTGPASTRPEMTAAAGAWFPELVLPHPLITPASAISDTHRAESSMLF